MTLIYIVLLMLVQWTFIGFKVDDIENTIVGKVIGLHNHEITADMGTFSENNEGFTKFGKEMINWELNVIFQMGIKRKSQVIGQYYDYLRLKGKL